MTAKKQHLVAALWLVSVAAASQAIAATQTLTPAHDTFINSASPDNNNGASTSIFTGKEGRGGAMRGLVRFAMPAGLSGRVTVTDSALTLGLLIVRYMFGLRGAVLVEKAVGSMPQRTTPDAIGTYLASIKPALDVDDNGEVDALTDGMIILRVLFRLRGAPAPDNAIGTAAKRTPQQIEDYVLSLMP